jgi:ribonuclease HI
MKYEDLIVYTDGGASHNPGPAGVGVVFCDKDKKVISRHHQFLGQATNNQAEYQAVLLALNIAQECYQPQRIQFLIDSLLVVEQLNGNYKIKDSHLQILAGKVEKMCESVDEVNFRHIPREQNTIADSLVKKAIKEKK